MGKEIGERSRTIHSKNFSDRHMRIRCDEAYSEMLYRANWQSSIHTGIELRRDPGNNLIPAL